MPKKVTHTLPVDPAFYVEGSYITNAADEYLRLYTLHAFLLSSLNRLLDGESHCIVTDMTIMLTLSDWYESIYDICRLHAAARMSGGIRGRVKERLDGLVKRRLITCFNENPQTHTVRRRRGVTINASIAMTRFYGLTPAGVHRLTAALHQNDPYIPAGMDVRRLRMAIERLKEKLLRGSSLTWPAQCDTRLRCWMLKG